MTSTMDNSDPVIETLVHKDVWPRTIARLIKVCHEWQQEDNWCLFMLDHIDLRHQIVEMTCRAMWEVPEIQGFNASTLYWLADLYLGFLPNETDQQLPVGIDRSKQNPYPLLEHLKSMYSTIRPVRVLFSWGFISLCSRENANKTVKRRGRFMLRISNSKPSHIALSWFCQHRRKCSHCILPDLDFTEQTLLEYLKEQPMELSLCVRDDPGSGREFRPVKPLDVALRSLNEYIPELEAKQEAKREFLVAYANTHKCPYKDEN